MISADKNWTFTLVLASLAIAFAGAGLGLAGLYPGAAPLVGTSLLAASLACTAGAFGRVALRLRRLELEHEGLVEEISQEFDRVKDKVEIFAEALAEPRSLTPDEVDASLPTRRVMVK
ncbi:MAG TPA: hypothetical protein VFH78_01830 [Candidatus Thermoplasmatota archaeon]|nr:hypothetical protein [Candidatus Thermoplasmatota archaeon]